MRMIDEGIYENDMEKKNKGKIVRNSILILLALILLAIIGVYAAGILYFQERFFRNTKINGFDVSEQTVKEVEERIARQVGSYQLEISERGGKAEMIMAKQMDYHYVSQGEVQTFLESQKVWQWPLCMWEAYSYTFDSSAQYDEKLLMKAINALECLDEEKVTKPKDAYIEFLDGSYHVIPETEGNLLDREKTVKLLHEAVDFARTKISLEEQVCYLTPDRRSDDEVLNATKDTLNTHIRTSVTYLFGNETESLNAEQIRPWIRFDDAGNVSLAEERVREFVGMLADKYNTADRPREFHTTEGRTVTVEGGSYGWLIDQETEVQALMECIRTGFQGERYPEYAQTAVSRENSDLGYNYVEIDLSKQHVWMYIDGEQIVSTDCVSGMLTQPDRTTPSGTYTLYYKQSPAVLRGANNEYETPVTYWMPFNGGIGLHDATWRGSFGGDIYVNDGSHGCINLPLNAAKTIYENIYDGMPIVCYY